MKQNNTFLIYDYETFGKDPTLDKPVQFASIRTNYNFQPIEEPLLLFCKPANDYLPEPETVLIHGITPQKAIKYGLTESEFAKKIYQVFNKQPYTCILGYNNINFDDEFSRNIFYRNFLDPYDWSWKQGNSRWDLFNIIRACYTLRPADILWPISDKGNPSFKLNHITNYNNIKHLNAHNAMTDVYATLELAKLIKNKKPKLFSYLYNHKNKHQLKKLINTKKNKLFIYVYNIFNINQQASCIIPIAWHPNNSNILIAYDLKYEVSKFLDTNITLSHDIIKLSNINKQKTPNMHFPLKLIPINKCPIIVPIKVLAKNDSERIGLDYSKCLKNLILFKQENKNIYKKTINIYKTHKLYKQTSAHVDTQLYKNFFNKADKITINKICNSTPKYLKNININFTDQRLTSLLFFYKARNFPYILNKKEKKIWEKYKNDIFYQKYYPHYINKLKLLFISYKDNMKKIKLLHELFKYWKNFQDT